MKAGTCSDYYHEESFESLSVEASYVCDAMWFSNLASVTPASSRFSVSMDICVEVKYGTGKATHPSYRPNIVLFLDDAEDDKFCSLFNRGLFLPPITDTKTKRDKGAAAQRSQ